MRTTTNNNNNNNNDVRLASGRALGVWLVFLFSVCNGCWHISDKVYLILAKALTYRCMFSLFLQTRVPGHPTLGRFVVKKKVQGKEETALALRDYLLARTFKEAGCSLVVLLCELGCSSWQDEGTGVDPIRRLPTLTQSLSHGIYNFQQHETLQSVCF